LCLLLLQAAGPGCGDSKRTPSGGRVLMIGLDGAEWNLIRPMMAAGEMPNLQKLVENGVSGDLMSLVPLQKSPAIWTTIITGKPPEEHGIRGFVDQVGGKPLTQNIRRVKALWNILSTTGRPVGVIGWLMSWPAEPVNGFVVSDYIQYQAAQTGRLENRTFPPSLYPEVAPLVRNWRAMSWAETNAFLSVPFDSATGDSALLGRLSSIKWMVSADQSFADIADTLGRSEPWDFLAVYLRSMDTMGHLFWNYQNPEAYPRHLVDPALAPYVKETMRRDYRFIDRQIGRLVTLADEKTTIIVCSDHGFVGGGGGGIRDHRAEGILVMAGHRIGKGEITGATVFDLTPTLLAIFGLPKAEDMRGKVLWQAFDGTIRPDMFPETIPTYETGDGPAGGEGLASPVDQELIERLKSLGYMK
ncbi:MAG: type I phosphodiesterase/nucleotide pyrophosphatase, partial [bacterium]